MASTPSVIPMVFFAVVLIANIATCRAGLKNQRNFAHVYGKRASDESFGVGQDIQNIKKFPMFSGEFQGDYAPSDESFFLRRDEPSVKTKANVAHMFGRELYDNYPVYGDFDVYPETELDEGMNKVATHRDDDMIPFPVLNSDMQHRGFKQRERFPLRDLLSPSQAVRMEALAYLDNLINSKRGKV